MKSNNPKKLDTGGVCRRVGLISSGLFFHDLLLPESAEKNTWVNGILMAVAAFFSKNGIKWYRPDTVVYTHA